MQETMSKLSSEEILGLVAIVGAFSCGLILGTLGILFGFYHQSQETRRTESLTALKQDMLGRGMSAHEIEAVLAAGLTDAKAKSLRHACRA